MTALEDETRVDEELADLLPDSITAPKGAVPRNAVPMSKKQAAKAARKAAARAERDALEAAATATKARAAQLAQIVNLLIAGHSFADIGAAIGASEDEVEQMMATETARYVRTQPALRVFVRNWISSKYTEMIEVDWPFAVDPNSAERLDNQDRISRMLKEMGRLHGAEAPVQSEIKMDAAPEAVEHLVAALAASQGLGYNANVFDTIPGSVVHDAVEQSHAALEVSGNRVEQSVGEGDDDDITA